MTQLRGCGEQYRLQRIEGTPSRPSTPAVAGKIAHTATEHIDKAMLDGLTDREELRKVGLRIVDQADEVIRDEVERDGFQTSEWIKYGRRTTEKPGAEDIDWFMRAGIPNCIDAYIDWRLSRTDLTIAEVPGFGPAIEVPFEYITKKGQLVRGFIDRIFTTDEGRSVVPMDIKTGRKPSTDEQLGLYAAALRRGLGWTATWGLYVYALKTGEWKQTPPINLTHWDDDKLAHVYGQATTLIDLGIYVPHPGESCQHCGVADHCAYVQSII